MPYVKECETKYEIIARNCFTQIQGLGVEISFTTTNLEAVKICMDMLPMSFRDVKIIECETGIIIYQNYIDAEFYNGDMEPSTVLNIMESFKYKEG